MSPADASLPLTRDRILDTAEDVIRRFGPDKATALIKRPMPVRCSSTSSGLTSTCTLRSSAKGYAGYCSYEAPNPAAWARDPADVAREALEATRAVAR